MSLLRFILPSILILIIDLYAFQALKTVSENWSQMSKNISFFAFWAIPAVTILFLIAMSMGLQEQMDKGTIRIIGSMFFIIYVAKLPIVFFLMIDDIRRLFGYVLSNFNSTVEYNPSRSRFLSNTGIVLGALPFLTLIYGILRNRYRYQVMRETVYLENLPEALRGLKIVQISDIHSGSFDQVEPVKRAVELINQEAADIVLFTGDLVNSVATEMTNYVDVFNKIKSKYGVFSVLGNHDYGDYHAWESKAAKEQNLQDLMNLQKGMGWDLLMNENRILNINGEKLAVLGVENYSVSGRFPKHGDLKRAYQGTEDVPVKLLLSHDPSHWEEQVTDTDIDITFSGHTHGMQFGIEIPGWFKWSPSKYAYKQWAGLYQKDKQFLYVNRGLGFLGYPGRVGILPEVTVLQLDKKELS